METRKYLQSFEDYFWQWEEGDSLLAIPNSSTIAYREYIVEILEHLSPQGMPPFGTLLLATIATNLGSRQSLADIETKLLSNLTNDFDLTFDAQKSIDKTFSFLRTLNNLPEKYREGEKRIQLFQLIFESCHNSISYKKAGYIINTLKFRRIPDSCFVKEKLSNHIVNKDLRVLELLSDKFNNSNDIIEALANLPEIEDIEIEAENTPIVDFVEELIHNDKTFHVGALIKSLWSGLNIPLHSNLPSQQPLGGVSDISNKGDFDKLLISEFANDTTVFLSRLANNEALYINREIPPQSNNLERVILIDISIRNWGTPKTLAYAIMLALAKHPKTKIQCVAHAVGKHYHPIEYNTIDTLIDALSNIDGCLTAYDGFKEFFAEKASGNQEIIVITTRDAVKYPQMKQLLEENRKSINYIVYTNADGEIDLYRQTPKTKKHLQSIVLPLENLWNNKPKKVKKAEDKEIIGTDANINNCPLLYTPNYYSKKIMMVQDDLYCIDNNCLYKKVEEHKGWTILYSKIEKQLTACQLGWNEKDELVLFLCYSNKKTLDLINIATGKSISKHYNKTHLIRNNMIFFIDNHFYIETSKIACEQISLDLEIREKFTAYDPIVEEEKKKTHSITSVGSVIKNLKIVSLTDNNEILINKKHTLRISENRVMICPNINYTIKETAYYQENGYTFRNGVTVVNDNGMLLITLKDKKIMHIPLIVDFPLAIAYDGRVAGNSYFYTNDAIVGDINEIASILKSVETWS